MSKVLVLFKPDVYQRQMQDEITAALDRLRLDRLEHFRVMFTPRGVFEMWPPTWGWRWTNQLMIDMPKRPLDVHVLDGEAASELVRELKEALRAEHAKANSAENLLHSSEDPVAFDRDYAYLKSIEVPA